MASVPLVPVALSPTVVAGLGQFFVSAPVNSPTGTAINLSAWVSLTAQLEPPANNPTGSSVSFGTVTGSSTGVITLETTPTDLATVPSGSARLYISGKPTSGDTLQLLSSGVCTVQTLNT